MNQQDMSPEEVAKAQQEQCIFCKIIAGQIPSQKIYEDDNVLAILDINPASEGHIILFPKTHYQIMPQIPDNELSNLFLISKKLSKALLQTYQSGGTTVFVANGGVAGQRAPHFMIHIVPRKKDDGLFKILKKEGNQNKLIQIQQTLIASLSKMFGRPVVEASSTKTTGESSSPETKNVKEVVVDTSSPNPQEQIQSKVPEQNMNEQSNSTDPKNNIDTPLEKSNKEKNKADLDKIGGMFLK